MEDRNRQKSIPLGGEKAAPAFFSLTDLNAAPQPAPAPAPAPRPARRAVTLSFINSKGGVGKTTTTVNMAAALAIRTPVLIVDLDPQASATRALGRFSGRGTSVADVLRGHATMADAVHASDVDGLSYVTAGIDLVVLQEELARRDGAHRLLDDALEPLRDQYGFILIDCPPTFGLLSRNALVASDGYFVPVQPHFLAMEGLQSLIRTMALTENFEAPYPPMLGIIPSMVDYRDPSTHENMQHLRGCYPEQVLQAEVLFDIHLAEAPARGQSIFDYAGRSQAARSYWQLSKELRARTRDLHARRQQDAAGHCAWG